MKISALINLSGLAIEEPTNVIRKSWDRLSPLPGGKLVFSRLVGRGAPYTATIRMAVEDLRDGYSRVTMADRPQLRNHLQCLHAIALANLVEVTGNLAVAYSQPDEARFIVAGMSIEYSKKARGTITGECHCPPIESSERHEYQVPVVLSDAQGDVVVKATLQTLVGPRKA